MLKPISLLKATLFVILSAFTSQAFAEYYVVQTTPPPVVVVCNSCRATHPVVYHKKYKKRYYTSHHRYHRHYARTYKRRSSYSISVYYPVVTSPCCGTPRPCNYCDACSAGLCGSQEIYSEPMRYYTNPPIMNYDENDFDYDRRTADDVGSDLDIDY